MTSPIVLRYFGASRLEWHFYDRTGRLVREVTEDEVPVGRLGPVTQANGGFVMADPQGGFYVARWGA